VRLSCVFLNKLTYLLLTYLHWCHLANTTELPSAHPGPQPKQQIDPFSCFCTALGR